MSIASENFDFVRQLLHTETGIVIGTHKVYLVEARLGALLEEVGAGSIDGLCLRLRRQGDPVLKRRVIEAMTTNETSFFRDQTPFRALREIVLPRLLERRSPAGALAFWSAACSTGQEPYSIALSLLEAGLDLEDRRISILATDVAEGVLEKARSGHYSPFEIRRGMPEELLDRYFEKSATGWRVRPDIRGKIDFRRHNLKSPDLPSGPFDVIFCRNVLIYFDRRTQTQIIDKLRRALRPDGYLFLGTAEGTLALEGGFEQVPVGETFCYRPGTVRLPQDDSYSRAR